MIRTSEQINELSESFAKAQAKFGAAIKASQNPAFRSKYADLASVIDATLEHLNAEGIGVMQHPALEFKGDLAEGREAFVCVTTRLQHRSGQWMESDVTIPAVQRDRFDAQSVGSAITYACRYALRSICTVPQADDDANEASGIGSAERAQAIGRKKIEELKHNKTNGDEKPLVAPTTLFYTWPENHKGFFAEFINVKQYGSALDEVAQEGLRQVFAKYGSKVTKTDTVLVASSKMDELLEKLAGDCGVTVKKLEAARA